jgi:hypothetical protein
LINVPYWWDKSADSLAATIRALRPDIEITGVSTALPIPLKPAKPRTRLKYVPNASKNYDATTVNPSGWYYCMNGLVDFVIG